MGSGEGTFLKVPSPVISFLNHIHPLSGGLLCRKTGTAEWGEDRAPHSWYVGYGQQGDQKIAVAVLVEEGGYGSRTAAPIAKDVMEAVIQP